MSRADRIFTHKPPETKNEEGYPAYSRPSKEEYIQMLTTNTLGNTFYASANQLLDRATEVHDGMVKEDPEFMAKALVFARNETFMRLQPVYGLAKLSEKRPDLFAKVFSKVCHIPTDVSDLMTILKSLGRGTAGRAVKRQLRNFLLNKVDPAYNGEYWAIKYNGSGMGFTLGDLIAISHPVPKNKTQEALFGYLVDKRKYTAWKEADLPKIHAYERLITDKSMSEQEVIETIQEGRLPFNVVTSEVKMTKGVWEAILKDMPIFATLRHLSTLEKNGVFDSSHNVDLVVERLSNSDNIHKAKILPFDIAQAYKHVHNTAIRDALKMALEHASANIPTLEGKTAIFLDASSSMYPGWSSLNSRMDYLTVGSIFALSLFKNSDAVFWLFNIRVIDPRASKVDSILSQIERIFDLGGGGTDTGAPIRRLTDERIKVDNIIMITDEQQNTGSSFYKNLIKYRDKVNGNVKTFIIDLSPYQGRMVPSTDKNTWYIYGWSDNVLKFIPKAAKGFGNMVSEVENYSL